MADNRSPVYVEEGSGLIVYRASGLDLCPMDLLSYRLSEVPEPFSEEILARFEAGRKAEELAISRMSKEGWSFKFTGDDQLQLEKEVMPGIAVRSHPDGIGWKTLQAALGKEAQEYCVEVKSMSTANFHDRYGHVKKYYRMQLAAERELSGLPILLAVKDFERGILEYVPSWYENWADKATWGEVVAKVMEVELAARFGNPLPCTRSSFFCRFPWHQPAIKEEAKREKEEVADLPTPWQQAAEANDLNTATNHGARDQFEAEGSEVEKLTATLYQLRRKQKGLEEETQSVQDALILALDGRPEVIAGEYKVTVQDRSRRSPDVAKVKEKLGKDYPLYEVTTTYRTVSVTKPRAKKDKKEEEE